MSFKHKHIGYILLFRKALSTSIFTAIYYPFIRLIWLLYGKRYPR
uniref:Uncharacterized protein n=1 Tax=Anguilla anguilla TaxID=7936 RepID=A0A0E9SWF3_ANGAN